ncbi:hypothetical protein [Pseudomonas sp. NyZ201]|uniref:hypothetical protein n=1 Tax=Pseudomonas sp. NyZ201 TaxID=3409857 RepID=UPI003CF7520B
MHLEFLARQSGVDVASVPEHKRIGRTDVLRIDPHRVPAQRRTLRARAEGIFKAAITADDLYRDFPVKFIDAFITDKFEDDLETPVDNTRHLAGVFRDVHFDVPNLHLFFPQAPNRPFVVDIANGHYGITGTW